MTTTRAQAPAPAPPQSYRAATTLIEVDAIVTDRTGRFIADLQPGDFEVFEQGKPRAIEACYLVSGGVVRAVPAAAGVSSPAVPPVSAPPVTRRLFILFFDGEHIDPGAFKRMQSAAEAFLKTEFREGDVGGVLVGGTMAGNRLTSSREELIAAVKGAKPSAERGFLKLDLQDWPRMTQVEAIRIAIDNDTNILRQVVDRAGREAPQGRLAADYTPNVLEKARYVLGQIEPATRRTLASLTGLLNGLAKIPGRKTIVMVSDGFFVQQSGGTIRDLVGMAARANARIYSIDPQGQDRRRTDTALDAMNAMESGGQIPVGAYDSTEDGPNSLAVDTGGFAVRNTNDFRAALASIAADTSEYYVLGFVASSPMDGKFKGISVKVKRPAVKVRARKGFLALAVATNAPAEPRLEGRETIEPGPPAAPPAGGAPASPSPGSTTVAGVVLPPSPVAAAGLPLRPDVKESVEKLAGRVPRGSRPASKATQGWNRYSTGDLEGAQQLLAEAAAEPGAPPWVWYALGFAQAGTGKPAQAIRSWEHVRQAAPDFETVWLDLADAYLQTGDAGKAGDVLREATARWPKDPEVWNALGTVQVRREAIDEALRSFGRAVKADPADGLGYFNLARTYELRYYRMRRFSQPEARWLANPADLAAAIENYQRYLTIGGPYKEQAEAAIARLQWVK